MNQKDIKLLVKLLMNASRLKDVNRTGWIVKGVKDPESVADHSWAVSLFCLLLIDKKINKEKVLEMAILHDLGEVVRGDVRWESGRKVIRSPIQKRIRELTAVRTLLKGHPLAKKYVSLLSEFNEQKTPESKFLKKVEKLEMIFQAYLYEKTFRNKKSLQEFWENAEKYLVGTDLEPLFRLLQKTREKNTQQ